MSLQAQRALAAEFFRAYCSLQHCARVTGTDNSKLLGKGIAPPRPFCRWGGDTCRRTPSAPIQCLHALRCRTFFSRQTTLGIVLFEGRGSYPICPPLHDANEVWEHSGPTPEQFTRHVSCMVCVVRPCARYFSKRKISRLFWVRTVSSFQFFFMYAGHQQMCFMLFLTMYTAVRKFKCLK